MSPQCNSNSVTAIQYCYRAYSPNVNSNDRQDVFDILWTSEDDFVIINKFTVLNGIPCRFRRNNSLDCCDTYKVPSEQQFQIPSTYSVYTTNSDRRLLLISGSANLSDWGQVSMINVLLLRFVTREWWWCNGGINLHLVISFLD